MKYKVGDKFFVINKSGETEPIEILDVCYRLNRNIGTSRIISENELITKIEKGLVSETNIDKQTFEIRKLEAKYGIKLEVEDVKDKR